MRTAEAGSSSAPAGAEDQLSRQYPKYYVVKGHLADMLAGLAPGQALPPERSLAESFATSRTTIRQALHELTIEGRLVRMQGRGTFAALPKIAQPLELTSYTEDMRRRGLASRSQLLSVGQVGADEELARRLDVRHGARVFRVERLRMASEEPMAIETTHLAAARFPGLARRLGDSVSLYAVARHRVRRPPGGGGRDDRDGACAPEGGRAAQHHRRLPDAAAYPPQPRQRTTACGVRAVVLPR